MDWLLVFIRDRPRPSFSQLVSLLDCPVALTCMTATRGDYKLANGFFSVSNHNHSEPNLNRGSSLIRDGKRHNECLDAFICEPLIESQHKQYISDRGSTQIQNIEEYLSAIVRGQIY